MLAANVQRGPAGGQDLDGRTVAEQARHEIGDPLQHVLTVVEQQQHLARAQVASELLRHGPVGFGRDTEPSGSGGDDEGRIGDRGEIDPGDSIREMLTDVAGDGEGKTGFPDAARPGQAEQRRGIVKEQGAGALIVPADEPGPGKGKIQAVERQRIGHGD